MTRKSHAHPSFILILLFLIFICPTPGRSEGPNIFPSLYLDFEYPGGPINPYNPAFYSRAPGLWIPLPDIGTPSTGVASFANDAGVDGHDCLDKTANNSWGGTFGPLDYSNHALNEPLDDLWSFTVCGWLKAEDGKPIGGDARLVSRPGQFEVYTPGGSDAGALALNLFSAGGDPPDTVSIPILNPSFEDNTLADGAYLNGSGYGVPDGWNSRAGGAYMPQRMNVWNPPTPETNSFVSGVPAGSNVMELGDPAVADYHEIEQFIPIPGGLTVGDTYTLTAKIACGQVGDPGTNLGQAGLTLTTGTVSDLWSGFAFGYSGAWAEPGWWPGEGAYTPGEFVEYTCSLAITQGMLDAGVTGITIACTAYTEGGYNKIYIDDVQLHRVSYASAISSTQSPAVYSNPGSWLFFAVAYDGTSNENNIRFYIGSQGQPVSRVSTSTIERGQLTGTASGILSVGSAAGGSLSTAGYLDKVCIYAEKANSGRGAFDAAELEKVRRWHLGLPELITGGLPGDTDLDGDVDAADVARVAASVQAASGPYYWGDGDFDGDLDVDQNDVDTANANFTGPATAPGIDVAVASNMVKVHTIADAPPQADRRAELWAAGGEHEGFQIVIVPKQYRITNIEVTAHDLAHETSGFIGAGNLSIRRVDTVRVSEAIDDPWPDPLMEETSGDAIPGKPLVFWVDIDVPYSAKSGIYEGNVTVQAPDGPAIDIPVELHVWGFNIPAEQNFHSSCAFFRAPLRRYYGGDWDSGDDPELRKWIDLYTEYRISIDDLSHNRPPGIESRHRFVKVTRKTDGSWLFDFTQLDHFLDYAIARGMANFNMGDVDTWHFWEPFYGYDEATGTYRVFDELSSSENEAVFDAYIQQAGEHYRMDGPRPYEDRAYFYSYDELSDSGSIQEMINRHDRIEQLWPALKTLTTTAPSWQPQTVGHLDIWVSKAPLYDTAGFQSWIGELRALGNEIWFYETGWDENNAPYFEIEEPALHHRIWFWYSALTRADGFLLWGSNLWPHYRYPEELEGIPPAEPYDRWPNRAWDDAGWVERKYYEGRCYQTYPGPNGPLASIRLEQIRDGIEDWEMLNMLGQPGSLEPNFGVPTGWASRGPNVFLRGANYIDVWNPGGDGSSIFAGGVPDGDNVLVLGSETQPTYHALERFIPITGGLTVGDTYEIRVKVALDTTGGSTANTRAGAIITCGNDSNWWVGEAQGAGGTWYGDGWVGNPPYDTNGPGEFYEYVATVTVVQGHLDVGCTGITISPVTDNNTAGSATCYFDDVRVRNLTTATLVFSDSFEADVVSDGEYLDGGIQTGSTRLIKQAEDGGVPTEIIEQAKQAADLTEVVRSYTDYTNNPAEIEAKRREVGDAIESLVEALGLQEVPAIPQWQLH